MIGATDPSAVIADRRIADAARRGAFDGLAGAGRPLPVDAHRAASAALGAAARAGGEMANVMADANVLPPSIEMRREVEARRAALLSALREAPRRDDGALREEAVALNALVDAQRHAAIGDALAFGGAPVQCDRFDLDVERAEADAD